MIEVKNINAINNPNAKINRGRESPIHKAFPDSDGDKSIALSIRMELSATNEL